MEGGGLESCVLGEEDEEEEEQEGDLSCRCCTRVLLLPIFSTEGPQIAESAGGDLVLRPARAAAIRLGAAGPDTIPTYANTRGGGGPIAPSLLPASFPSDGTET